MQTTLPLPTVAEARVIIDRLRRLVQIGRLNQCQIADKTGVDQSQISRILAGHFQRVSKNVNALCKYEYILHDHLTESSDSGKYLLRAIHDVWDGTDKHALALANVIRSLRGLKPADTGPSSERAIDG